jgi:hypothetical protein
MNFEAGITSNGGGGCVEFKTFYLKSVARVDPQTATLVATDVEKPPRPGPLIEGYVSIEKGPEPIQK